MNKSSLDKKDHVLIITLFAGGGHKSAAIGVRKQLLQAGHLGKIVEKEYAFDWFGPLFGQAFRLWNMTLRHGMITMQQFLQNALVRVDALFFLPAFLGVFRTLIKHRIDYVIDTQPISMNATLYACKLASYVLKKPILYEKVLTELPTKRTQHFFWSIKRLSKKLKAIFKLRTTHPLTESNKTEEDFWQDTCNLSIDHIEYAKLPLKPAFFEIDAKRDDIQLPIQLQGLIEKQLICNLIADTHLQYDEGEEMKLSLKIPKDLTVTTIMLGSTPDVEAMLSYADHLASAHLCSQRENHLAFLLYNEKRHSRSSFLMRLYRTILTKKNGASLCVIPLSFQSDSTIATLLSRSDNTITRSGGLTSMELLQSSLGQIWIHERPGVPLQRGMPSWELGNAEYLQHKKNAKFITPEEFAKNIHLFDAKART